MALLVDGRLEAAREAYQAAIDASGAAHDLLHLLNPGLAAVHQQRFHRIAHGGPEIGQPLRVDEQLVSKLEKLVPLAPLHQPHNLAAIRADELIFRSDRIMLRDLSGQLVFDRDGIAFTPVNVRLDGGTKATIRGSVKSFEARVRIDTPEELVAYRNGGILPYVLRQLIKKK